MAVFTSRRERRFWLLALIVVAAIYSSVGLAGTLAEQLREQGLLGVAFGLCFIAVIAVIVGSTLKRFPRGQDILAVIGIATVYGMVVVRMGIGPEERSHLFEYGLVATFIHQALLERRGDDRRPVTTAFIAVAATALLGWIDEGIQELLPDRVYDIRDIGVNALAGVMAIVARMILIWFQEWRSVRS